MVIVGPYADYDIQLPQPSTFSVDTEGFNDLLRTAGLQVIHQAATICPIGLQTLNDPRRSHPDHSGCFNGMIYRDMGIVSVYGTQNVRTDIIQMLGIVDDSQIISTFPTNYDDKPDVPFYPMMFDRFIYIDSSIKTVTTQKLEHNPSGTDRLEFPATDIIGPIVDADGKEYFIGTDFQLNIHGYIEWIPGGNTPPVDLNAKSGKVIAIRYLYRPSWYCARIMKETRFAKKAPFMEGPIENVRLPTQVLLQREYVFFKSDNDVRSLNPEQLNRNVSPSQGSFGVK